jgi:steroid 5-alpha reductase family enzyme
VSGISYGPLLINSGATALAVLVTMAATLAVAQARHKHSVIDVVWGLGFAIIAVVTYVLSTGEGDDLRRLLLLLLPVLWGGRLALYIGMRNAGKPEDPRYVELLAGEGHPVVVALRKVYLPQGVVMWLVSLVVQVGAYTQDKITFLAWVGVGVWLVGLFFEGVGDAQLAAFKRDPANKGQVMDRGLWRYTRHPNYFGDACVWWGIWLVAGLSWPWLVAALCPALMTYLITAKTGKALLEKSMGSSKPGYADYVQRTSGFFPLPPKRTDPSPAGR